MEKSEGIFASALKRLTVRDAPAGAPRVAVPGAIKQIRGASYPPLYSPAAAAGASTSTAPSSFSDIRAAGSATPSPSSSRPGSVKLDAGALPGSGASRHPASPLPSPLGGLEEAGTSTDARTAPDALSAAGAGATVSLEPVAYDRTSDPVLTAAIRGSLRCSGKEWEDDSTPVRLTKFQRCLDARNVDVETLRGLAWSGVPCCFRIVAWQTLLGYLPANKERQASSLSKKKLEYQQCVAQYFSSRSGKTEPEQVLLRQILVDVPRTFPDIPLLRSDFVQRSLERVLYVWALRHPASGYVQGINDLATPFYAVFLSPWVDIDSRDLSHVDPVTLLDIEADVYWCLTKLLDGIQDHYTPSQPGIQRMTFRLRELVHRIDESLVKHLESNGVEFQHLAFRWMNCLLMRELPFKLIIRVWDTCLAEKDGFDGFHVYLCAALLLKFASQLKVMKFQELVTFVQKLPTRDWKVKDVEELLAQAFVYKSLFESSPSHLS